jgi:hypothetical protein
VNKVERDAFEMKWQLPYGYKDCQIFNNEVDAIDYIRRYNWNDDYILEKYNNGMKEDLNYERT